MIEAEYGGIYTVSDDPQNPIIKFPKDNIPAVKRTFHSRRYALVIQADPLNKAPHLHSALVIPLSHRGENTPSTLVIYPRFSEDIPNKSSVALVHLTQPILKNFLIRKVAQLDKNGAEMTNIRAIFCRIVGLM